jgi:hypothetical protein
MSRGARLVLALLIALFAVRLVDTARRKSFTYDEPHYVGTGLYLWATGDYQWLGVLSGQTPLAFHVASLPFLAVDRGALGPGPQPGIDLLRRDATEVGRVRFVSRLPFVALACWGAWMLFAWARAAGGTVAGLIAVFCLTFCPTVLAHSSLAHSDVTVTVFHLQTLWCLWRWWMRPTRGRLALAGVSLGLALIAKQSALLLLPAIGLLVGAAAALGRPATGAGPWSLPAAPARRAGWAAGVLGTLGALAVFVVWCGYGFSFATAPASAEPDWGWPVPGYLRAMFFDWKANSGGRQSYLLGEFAQYGWWYFFPVAFAVKTPLGLLALLALTALPRGLRPRSRPAGAGIGWFVAVPVAVWLVVACFVLKVPLGIRYLLPIYPLLWLLVGVRLGDDGPRWRDAAAIVAGLWLAVASLAIHPHYLAYFNEAAGGPANGRRWLVESNLDWGQDLRTLAGWLLSRGNPPVRLGYFGRESAASYALRVAGVPGCTRERGLVAISVNVLQGLYTPQGSATPPSARCYDWLEGLTPIAAPGWSILVYDVPP